MSTGIPELDMPPLDPINNDLIDFKFFNMTIVASVKLGEKGDKVDVTDLDLAIKLQDIHIEMECLFPRNGNCCERKFLKSCNSVLAKTVHRFINKGGRSFVDKFQPEISKQIKKILLGYFRKAIASAKSSYFIDV